jgi:5'/3'-nucleotidase SurE
VFDALEHAGHEVVLAGPGENQTGSGSSVQTGQLQVRREAARQYSVWACVDADCQQLRSASAATSALAAIDLAALRPVPRSVDLLVSGINAGPNVGTGTVISGTVGAARVAATGPMGGHVPAIAVSTELPKACAGRADCEREHYDRVATRLLVLIKRLQARRSLAEPLLPNGLLLNVNVPAGVPRGLRVVPIADQFYARGQFIEWRVRCADCASVAVGQQAGTALAMAQVETQDPRMATDAAMFADGFLTISVLRPDHGPVNLKRWRWLERDLR